MEDKRIRQLVIAVLVVVLVLGLLNIVSTAFSLLLPLALAAAGAFAFYKIVLEGRDKPAAMDDEVAETAGLAAYANSHDDAQPDNAADVDEETDEARRRLSAVERARSEYLNKATPAEEILDHIKSRKAGLREDDRT